MKIKTYLILSGAFLFLFSCGKNEKQLVEENAPSLAVQSESPKAVEKLIFKKSEYIIPSDELDLNLLKKTAENLKIKYTAIKTEDVSSIRYNENVTFFVISIIDKSAKAKSKEEDLGNYYERKYVFVNSEDGKILHEETDKNLGYYENEGLRAAKTYILKDLLQLNDKTPAIALSTEVYSNSRVVMYSEEKFTILTFDGKQMKKVLYEYPIRSANGDSNGGGTYQIETLETGISISDTQTNGFYDLMVSKIYSYEDAVEEDLANDIQQKSDLKVKKEFQRLKFDGKTYLFNKDDRSRFL
ncbi:hypothetical protein L1276_001388 [Flavobacterium sp. HSC-32F16]|uniref:hypothetical protein n=1 Tax=Flavobacterium sp. HSC-32F16 TaxID=2910964 RepID=UPI0020A504DB|nr:hypothetical protein [Flavobacterium sp. HSC-32F16]MCP2026244.1 hypothetical protein [Flavobacterium sp. HSC-32F16]